MSIANEEQYVESVTNNQNRLWGYIHSLVGDLDRTQDILQETNRKLWQIRDQYDSGRPFIPWAFKVAFNQVRAARKREERERLVFHDDETLRVLADGYATWSTRLDERALALESCLAKLDAPQRDLLQEYYGGDVTIKSLAEAMGRQANAVAVSLHRIRQALTNCIKGRVP